MAIGSILFLLFTLPFLSSKSYARPTHSSGFAVELINRDSPRSPYYKPDTTPSERWTAALQRSAARLNYLKIATRARTAAASPQEVQIPVTPTSGEYLMKISIGTPPVPVYLNIDTGSDLIWLQCVPCSNCYKQNIPIFDPSKSSTFRNLSCNDDKCNNISENDKVCNAGQCGYVISYEDGSSARGDIVRDTFTMPSTEGAPDFTVPDMVFGCARDIHGFGDPDEAGVAGFNLALLSFNSQVGESAGYKFSYCFVPNHDRQSGSQMVFGDRAVLAGNATSLVERSEEFYYVDLYDLSVGPDRLGTPAGIFRRKIDGTGGFIVDSGTTLTYLVKAGYDMLVKKLTEVVKFRVASEVESGELCFDAVDEDLTEENFPTITFHFDGLDVPIHPFSSFMEIFVGNVCLMMRGTDDLSMLGNFAQQNLNVGFDEVGERIYMVPTECATF